MFCFVQIAIAEALARAQLQQAAAERQMAEVKAKQEALMRQARRVGAIDVEARWVEDAPALPPPDPPA
jgi:hypothetical protein